MSNSLHKNAFTEEQALTQWCPFARVRLTEAAAGPGVNRTVDDKVPPCCTCIASDCMAWQWVDDLDKKRGGYCGLASR